MNKTPLSPLTIAKQSIIAEDKKYPKKYEKFFKEVTGWEPLPFQVKYHKTRNEDRYKALSVPTGLGKTVTILCDWLYRRIHSPSETPRRLFYVVPLRTLVTQLTEVIKDITERAELQVPVYTLMGGSIQDEFVEHPEQPAIIITTLDQLVSRQLLRPYSASVKSSLMHFAATQDDAAIVLDEAQLMGEALGTSIVLHEMMLKQPAFGFRELTLCSATNDISMVDTTNYKFSEVTLTRADFKHPVAAAKVCNEKSLSVYPKRSDAEICDLALSRHKEGGLTLIIANTVKRSQAIYQQLDYEKKLLVHSRFRKADRSKLEKQVPTFKGIIVATSCIEAGVDISADVLITELCPWSSLVQRAGRCARVANSKGEVHVIESNSAVPYKADELDATASRLSNIEDMSIQTIMRVAPVQNPNNKPNQIDLSFIKRLFDPRNEEPISRYVRVVNNPTIGICWRYPRHLRKDMPKIDPLELCPCYPNQALEIIKKRKDVWVLDEEATQAQRPFKPVWRKFDWSKDKLEAGMEFVVGTAAKNYSTKLGLILGCRDRVKEVKEKTPPRQGRNFGYGDDSKNKSLGLVAHLSDTANFCKRIGKDIQLHYAEFDEALKLSGYLHDWGKASHVFQTSLMDYELGGVLQRDPERPLAKGDAYLKHETGAYIRRGWRHEVASALAMLEMGCKDALLTVAVMAHHGQVVSHLRALRDGIDDEQSITGIQEGDTIPAIKGKWKRDIQKPEWIDAPEGYAFPEVELKNPNEYVKQYRDLFDEAWIEYGPLVIATFGSLLRVADHRASAMREAVDTDEI